jgi:hypothetical protein
MGSGILALPCWTRRAPERSTGLSRPTRRGRGPGRRRGDATRLRQAGQGGSIRQHPAREVMCFFAALVRVLLDSRVVLTRIRMMW